MEDLHKEFRQEGYLNGVKQERDRIKELIDEMQRYGSNGLKMIYYIDGDELKARITGK